MFYKTIHGTKIQAENIANRLEIKLKPRVGFLENENMVLGEFLDEWLANCKNSISGSTYKEYQRRVRRLKPVVGDLQIHTLDSLQLKERLMMLDKGFSTKTHINLYITLRTALNWGVRANLIAHNIMDRVKLPKVQRRGRDLLTANELKIFLNTAKENKYYLVLRILALTGMRVSEVLGLRWKNVYLDVKKVHIVEFLDFNRKETQMLKSTRIIKLDEETICELIKYRKSMLKQNQAKEYDLVFQSDYGSPLNYQVINMAKEHVLKRAKLHHIQLSDLRRGVGSNLLENGYSVIAVAEYLGQMTSMTLLILTDKFRKGCDIDSPIE